VSARREECDPQQFWLSVLGALRQTAPGSALVRELTAAPDLDGWAIVERLLKDLAPLDDRVWLVVDDVHELGSEDMLRQLELPGAASAAAAASCLLLGATIASVRSSPYGVRKREPMTRSNWPGSTAGPTSPPSASPT
jgi:hypothetical protein